jgi:[acyl-carrier-protein] S-malonyltransferase
MLLAVSPQFQPPVNCCLSSTGNQIKDAETLAVQQAIYAVSASYLENARNKYDFRLLAGHSLGFYAALYAAGSIDFDAGFHIIRAAHDAIVQVSGAGTFGMTAIIGIKWDIIENYCRDYRDLYVANINSATQIVVSGAAESLDALERRANKEGALRVLRLPVRYPLHTPILSEVPDIVLQTVDGINISEPEIPVVDHTTGELLTSAGGIRKTLTEQFVRRVIWRDVIRRMWSYGIRRFIEVGPGDTLSRLARWIERDAKTVSLDSV